MDRLSYSMDNEQLTFSTQCIDCNIPAVTRGVADEEGFRIVRTCGCLGGEPVVTKYDTDAEMRAAFETDTAALITDVTIDAQEAAATRQTVEVQYPDGRTRSVPWNDQQPNRGMVAVLLEAAGDDTVDGEVLPPEELVKKFAPIDLARILCSRAAQARAALVEPTIVLQGGR